MHGQGVSEVLGKAIQAQGNKLTTCKVQGDLAVVFTSYNRKKKGINVTEH